MSLEPTAPHPAPAFTADEERPITGRPFLVPLYVPHFTARSRVELPIKGKLALLSEKGLRKECMHEGTRSGSARQDGAAPGADAGGGRPPGAGVGPQGGADAGRGGRRRRARARRPREGGGRWHRRAGRGGLRRDNLR